MSGKTKVRDIPSRRVLLTDPSQLPIDYSSTPGGTLFSTTPGGTRIIYERHELLQLRNSPLTRTPPKNLPKIAGVTSPSTTKGSPQPDSVNGQATIPEEKKCDEDPQFEMDI
ncbi:PREDICTED: eukaryotic translation initiation factor 4E-binding protein 1-like [Priapulus caudatus]|uniref:Eukaryotic translation initiation factor 4E-binding protein 1-like n=1 Tax=Priapulus caudatus TaxID=37621 RepID=A0ABM1F139_PRICU|nr:PREDICTED: eukaryotic translation initiation factor 4E-binding protein 1-like [Priapulus caudatus]